MSAAPQVRILVLLVLCAAGVALVGRAWHLRPKETTGLVAPQYLRPASPSFLAEAAAIRKAESIEDESESCADYPDPAGYSWDPAVVAAYCRVRSYTHLSIDEIEAALADGGKARLAEAFAGYQRENFDDPSRRGVLIRSFRSLFFNAAPRTGEVAESWVTADENSTHARVARGLHRVALAEAARGEAWIQQTPRENIVRMREHLDRAREDLEWAIRRDGRQTAALHGLLHVARLANNDALLRESVETAMAVDPTDERLYFDWMHAVEPRWGGSIEAMNAVAAEAERHADANPLLKLLRGKPIAERAELAWHRRRYAEAMKLYDEALRLGPDQGNLPEMARLAAGQGDHERAVRYYSQAYRFSRDPTYVAERSKLLVYLMQNDWALEDVDRLLTRYPQHVELLLARGTVQWHGRPHDAEQAYRTVLEIQPAHEAAGTALARLYVTTGALDKAAALTAQLLEKHPQSAALWLARGMATTRTDPAESRKAFESYLRFVDSSDPNQRAYIEEARRRLQSS